MKNGKKLDFKKLFMDHSYGMIKIDPETGVVRDFNHKAAKIYSFKPEVEYHFQDICPSVDTKDNFTLLQKGKIDSLNCTFEKNGSIINVKMSLIPFKVDENSSLLLMIEDVTKEVNQKKQLEELNQNLEKRFYKEFEKMNKQQDLLVQKSKLESLGKLASGIAHEINQPLGIISMGIDNLYYKFNLQELDKNYFIEKYDLLKENLSRISRIINQIRTFTRTKSFFKMEEIRINETIKDTLGFVRTQYANHGINLQLELKPHDGFTLGSREKLMQVFINVFSNARHAVEQKAKRSEGKFEKKIIARSYDFEESIVVEVIDNGIGIHKNELPKVFDPFYTTKDVDVGTGIGLSISLGIVEKMNGKIEFESELGSGTTVKIILPKFTKADIIR